MIDRISLNHTQMQVPNRDLRGALQECLSLCSLLAIVHRLVVQCEQAIEQ